MHLRDQFIDPWKAPLAPQAADEGDAKNLAVEVALEVDQMGLDEQSTPRLEGRPAVCKRRIDPVARSHQVVGGHDVGGRKAELAAAAVTLHHRPLEQEGGAE